MQKELHIMFAGGGTGGHLYPGLAVAGELERRVPAIRITFCGTGQDWERAEVTRLGYDYCLLPAAPLVVSPFGVLRAIYSTGMGYRAARRAVCAERPHAVIALGGYSSVPLGLAAARLDIPLVLLEQNVIPGRANQLLSRWAALVCVAFDVTGEHLAAQARTVSTGNPLRGSIERAAAQVARATLTRDARPTLLVLGGSRGAHNINLYMTAALAKVAPALGPWQVIHQTGTRDLDEVRAAYSEASIAADVHAFIEDMAAVYSCASVAICRAGATTLAELAVMGIPAILIPYPLAAANHQWHNAQAFARRGAAVVVEDRPEPGRSVASLVASLLPLVKIDELRSEMRRAMQGSGRLGASALVASEILELVGARGYVRRSA